MLQILSKSLDLLKIGHPNQLLISIRMDKDKLEATPIMILEKVQMIF